MVCFMHSHKCLKDWMNNLMDVMTRAGVQHSAQMNMMSDLHGGRDNWMFMERDFRNRFDPSHIFYVFQIIIMMMLTLS
jgi:hypothetical protein